MIPDQPTFNIAVYCVPDLQFDVGVAHRDHFGSEFDSDGDLMLLSEASIDEL